VRQRGRGDGVAPFSDGVTEGSRKEDAGALGMGNDGGEKVGGCDVTAVSVMAGLANDETDEGPDPGRTLAEEDARPRRVPCRT
jgi:hypothetical protein